MNYRHAFHAGNFADVFKHIVLMRVLAHLRKKETPFRVIDTHAGAGNYDLASDEAQRSGEWRDGIALFDAAAFSPQVEALVAPYRAALSTLRGSAKSYPGSPLLVKSALRAEDHMSVNELHPETAARLRRVIGRDERVAHTEIDAYIAWKAQIPPPERRGMILIDPPFEKTDEFQRMAEGLAMMARKWPTGSAALWYPIKNRAAVGRFEEACRATGLAKLLVLEIHVDDAAREGPLAACGMLIANPPWMLAEEMTLILPELSAALARDAQARWAVDWLAKA